ncbi:hypothetical protein COEREDRAFT_5694 [Coemansia reversa NRRL 1564]|uniref:DNA-directed RNA polymerase III subunit n=1 Tax=Coemansia reversa (strain ATCC 12441 / NRRL 1564) TaxID=763665 RepID=A0A2G5BJI0_COERN|nr:hypothetical protein COEREDRAFT_5694 [Coemansia reversa NRRL 1564]|eukprot:PIA19170.1 hypothetical protein COEREDRAFT_5694 [Coemansia reversa NRRL 1564]
MSRGRGRGRGRNGIVSSLQTELANRDLFENASGKLAIFPSYEVTTGRAISKEEAHIADLMEQFRSDFQESMFYLQPPPPPPDIERYSDRYFKDQGKDKKRSLKELKTDINLFPEELHSVLLKKRVKRAKVAIGDKEGLLEFLENTKDEEGNETAKDKSALSGDEKSDEGDEQDQELLEAEEEEEEENDYMDSYFNNGEEDDIEDIDDDGGGGDYD